MAVEKQDPSYLLRRCHWLRLHVSERTAVPRRTHSSTVCSHLRRDAGCVRFGIYWLDGIPFHFRWWADAFGQGGVEWHANRRWCQVAAQHPVDRLDDALGRSILIDLDACHRRTPRHRRKGPAMLEGRQTDLLRNTQ